MYMYVYTHTHADVRVRRVGGAFGGKLMAHLPTAVVAAVAAAKVKAPGSKKNKGFICKILKSQVCRHFL